MYPSIRRSDLMNATSSHHSPVILLLGKQSAANDPFDRWLEASPYRAWEASDVFQLLDQVSDYTVRNWPDVVFLHVGATVEELDFIRSLIDAGTSEAGLPVIDLVNASSSLSKSDLDVTISSLRLQLDQFIPQQNAATS